MSNESPPDFLVQDRYASPEEIDDIVCRLFVLSPAWIVSSCGDNNRVVVGDDYGYYSEGASLRLLHLANKHGSGPVAFDFPVSLTWIFYAYAALFLGLKIVPIDPRWPESRRQAAIARCSIHLTADVVDDFPLGRNRTDTRPIDWSVDALELETSGSSGEPKRIVHTRTSLAAQAVLGGRAVGLHADSHWVSALPMTHASGLGVMVRSLVAGSAMTVLPEFDPEQFISVLKGQGDRWRRPATVISLVPTMLERLLDFGFMPEENLESVILGGAPLDDDLRGRALEARIPVRESWGMTETLGMISLAPRPFTPGAGIPLRGVDVRADASGELLVRGPIVAPGLAGEDGWFRTGDAGFIDEHGFVHVTGRIGSLIISGGENVHPEAVERGLLVTGLVADAHVFGRPDREWGQVVVAKVVVSDSATTGEQVRSAVRNLLSPWEVPKEIELVDSVDRNELGKLDRSSNAGH